jgi:hypothetical protein
MLLQQYQRNTYLKKKKNSFTKSSFVTLLLVSQNALYDSKVVVIHFDSDICCQMIIMDITNVIFSTNYCVTSIQGN